MRRWDDPLHAEVFEQMLSLGLDEDTAEAVTIEVFQDEET